MSMLTVAIIIAFVLGYACIALESVTRVNKAAVALLMMVVCWTLFVLDPSQYITGVSGELLYEQVNHLI